MIRGEFVYGRKEMFLPFNGDEQTTRNIKLIKGAVRKGLSAGANYFKKEAQKSFESEMGHYPHKVKKHVNSYAKLLTGIRMKVSRHYWSSIGQYVALVNIMGHPLLHLFESGAGDGHYKRTMSYKTTLTKSGRKMGRPRKYLVGTRFGSKKLADGTRVRVTKETKASRGRIEATHFFKKVKENPSVMNEITRRIDTTFHNEMNKILKRLGQ